MSKEIALISAEHPTFSINAGAQIAKRVTTVASALSVKTRKSLTFDISRQNISKTQLEIVKEIISQILKQFNENPSTLVIDH